MDNYEIKTAPTEEIDLFYSNDERDVELGCIGHLRADFGRDGKQFWSSWFEHCSELKTQAFKDELDLVINHLREKDNMLHSLSALTEFCHNHTDAQLNIKYRDDTYGFKIDTEAHSYYIRSMLTQGDNNLYCYCYVRGGLEQCRQNGGKR